jgi:DNA-binding NarL/FixJ family response regulator
VIHAIMDAPAEVAIRPNDEARLAVPSAYALLVVDDVRDQTARDVAALRDQGVASIVVVSRGMRTDDLTAVLDAAVDVALRRAEATEPGQREAGPEPRIVGGTRLSEREANVLRLLADGFSNAEVGRRLFLSERSVKNAVHDVINRFELRNRTHAVVHALRTGLI